MSTLPDGIESFIGNAGWGGAVIEPLPGDASFRRYFRLRRTGEGEEPHASRETAMLMHAPPPEEDPQPFLLVAQWLTSHGMRAPQILAQNPREGWVLIEDFGDDRMRDWLDTHPGDEEAAYIAAIDALVDLHGQPAGPFSPYDTETYLRETCLFTQWFTPAHEMHVDDTGYDAAWRAVLEPLAHSPLNGVTVLRDYHAENIMLLDGKPGAPQGIIDFQDALVGHVAYDLVSLLQDARRDVDQDLESRMLDHYRDARRSQAGNFDPENRLEREYAVLGAQRNAKIVGIFTRLAKRDGKPRYLTLIPRVWKLMETDLAHPALEPVARWFDANIPDEMRRTGGGTIS